MLSSSIKDNILWFLPDFQLFLQRGSLCSDEVVLESWFLRAFQDTIDAHSIFQKLENIIPVYQIFLHIRVPHIIRLLVGCDIKENLLAKILNKNGLLDLCPSINFLLAGISSSVVQSTKGDLIALCHGLVFQHFIIS